MSPQAHVSEHLNRWLGFLGRLLNHWEQCPCWRNCFTDSGIGEFLASSCFQCALCSLYLDKEVRYRESNFRRARQALFIYLRKNICNNNERKRDLEFRESWRWGAHESRKWKGDMVYLYLNLKLFILFVF